MSDIPDIAEWSNGIEIILKREAETSQSYFWLHNTASRNAAANNDYIQIPAIILQTITGFLAATTGLVPPLALGAFSILTGIMSTILSYYRFSAKSEGHRIVAELYLKIFKEIEIQLNLPPEQRTSPSKLLVDIKDKLDHIGEISPTIPDNVIAKYKNEFKNTKSAKPIITNGLDEISIYKGEAFVAPTPHVDAKPDIKITFSSPVGSPK